MEHYWRENGQPRVYDVIGLIPRSNFIWHFLGPHQERSNSFVLETLQRERPDVIFAVARITHGGPRLADYIEANYIPIGGGVWAQAINAIIADKPELEQLLQNIKSSHPQLTNTSEVVLAYIIDADKSPGKLSSLEKIRWSDLSKRLHEAVRKGPQRVSFTTLPAIYLPQPLYQAFQLDLQPLKLW